MVKTKWLAGYGSFLDWYIVPATPENIEDYADMDGDEYESFADAKKAIIEIVRQKIDDDRAALKSIRKVRKSSV